MRWPFIVVTIVLCFGADLARPNRASAHEGPPFPILVDQPIPGYLVSVWADPDVGEATFYVVMEPQGSPPAGTPQVSLWVQPVSERLPKAEYPAVQECARNHLRFLAQPKFDVEERWTVGVDLRMPDGTSYPLVMEVEATPPGFGKWDLLVNLFPFVLFGGMWGFAFLRRRRTIPAASSAPAVDDPNDSDPSETLR